MVKICPSCGEKNFDDARKCMKCNENIKYIQVKPDNFVDEFEGMAPRGATPNVWKGRYFGRIALILVGLYFVFLLIFPLYILLFVFSIFTIVFGKFAMNNGDEYIGKFTFVVGAITFIITLAFFIAELSAVTV